MIKGTVATIWANAPASAPTPNPGPVSHHQACSAALQRVGRFLGPRADHQSQAAGLGRRLVSPTGELTRLGPR